MDVIEDDHVRINALFAIRRLVRLNVVRFGSMHYPSYKMLPKITPVSVEETLMVACMLMKS
jgi:hypothetical protein